MVEIAPDDTPPAVENGDAAALPRDVALELIRVVCSVKVVFPSLIDKRIEFSIHPRGVGYQRSRMLLWEITGSPSEPAVPLIRWPNRLSRHLGDKAYELERLRRVPLLIVDEVGYIPFDPEAAALFFALISSRYERASLIVSSNKTFSAWAKIFGDAVAVAAMVDRLVHHAEVFVLQGDSYRLKDRAKEVVAAN